MTHHPLLPAVTQDLGSELELRERHVVISDDRKLLRNTDIRGTRGLENAGSDQEVAEIADRLAGAVAAEPFRVAGQQIALTASVGVAGGFVLGFVGMVIPLLLKLAALHERTRKEGYTKRTRPYRRPSSRPEDGEARRRRSTFGEARDTEKARRAPLHRRR